MKNQYKNKIARSIGLSFLAATLLISGCANTGARQTSAPYSPNDYADNRDSDRHRNSRVGVIESIRVITTEGGGSRGVGAVVGGVAGGLLGSAFGGGTGKVVTTVAGAVGGAVVGNNVEKNRNQGSTRYEIRVRLNNGEHVVVEQDQIENLRDGSRVRLIDGRVFGY